jgi:hypothetical protein
LFFAGQMHHIVDWAKADLHQDVIDWADVIICHHYLESWIVRQWDRLRDKRVIWRTCGQSNALLEEQMLPLHEQGLQIVRYSPAEERAFTRLGTWAGKDMLIRFGKYPDDYGPWIGDNIAVGNVTQNMAGRGEFCGLYYWLNATQHLPSQPAGLQSEDLPKGLGALTYPEMIDYLNHLRCYLYTGTQPASYTLAMIEAMMSGIPTMSMGRETWWVPDLFEGPDLLPSTPDPAKATAQLGLWLRDKDEARAVGDQQRRMAIELFGIDTIAAQWQEFLGEPVESAMVSAPAGITIQSEPTPYDPTAPGLPIRHHVPRDWKTAESVGKCVWCGRPTSTLAETPFRPDLGAVPLMVTCGAHLRIVYRMIEQGREAELDAWERKRLGALKELVAVSA